MPIGPVGNVQYMPIYSRSDMGNMTPEDAADLVKQYSNGIDPFAPISSLDPFDAPASDGADPFVTHN